LEELQKLIDSELFNDFPQDSRSDMKLGGKIVKNAKDPFYSFHPQNIRHFAFLNSEKIFGPHFTAAN